MTERQTVTVGCLHANGLRLTVGWKAGKDLGAVELRGFPPAAAPGEPRSLVGYTDVDAVFWRAWLEDNADSPLVWNGTIFEQQPATVGVAS
jgi:hypothetical protein